MVEPGGWLYMFTLTSYAIDNGCVLTPLIGWSTRPLARLSELNNPIHRRRRRHKDLPSEYKWQLEMMIGPFSRRDNGKCGKLTSEWISKSRTLPRRIAYGYKIAKREGVEIGTVKHKIHLIKDLPNTEYWNDIINR